ncbi:phosphatase PAP2 family protein [Pseudodesulfovibrio indicus]|uniref:phosphatase PAP2 family protein n=1 Tax=Pseudodesulfovibrio indicus TaxID=1716143 RepID=UPI00292DC201|nr:phosphatase PAP2 family protein [Pseudodesulfovibrio indicus]
MRTILIRTLWAVLATALLVAVCYLFVDRAVSEAAFTLRDTIWHRGANALSQAANSVFFSFWVAAGLVLGGADALRNGLTPRSRAVLFVCLSTVCAMAVGESLKELCGRARPPLLFTKGVYGFFPFAGDYMHASFPSGHTLRIFSSMTALGLVLPRLRVPALALAVVVGASRVLALKHYPSDVLAGALVGIVAAIWCHALFRPGQPR